MLDDTLKRVFPNSNIFYELGSLDCHVNQGFLQFLVLTIVFFFQELRENSESGEMCVGSEDPNKEAAKDKELEVTDDGPVDEDLFGAAGAGSEGLAPRPARRHRNKVRICRVCL